jgi:hypothetical protein
MASTPWGVGGELRMLAGTDHCGELDLPWFDQVGPLGIQMIIKHQEIPWSLGLLPLLQCAGKHHLLDAVGVVT